MREFMLRVIVLALGVATIAACGGSEPAPTPTVAPTPTSIAAPTPVPTATATPAPSPTPAPTATAVAVPTRVPTQAPTAAPATPTGAPTSQPDRPGELSAQDILDASFIAMSEAESFHFKMDARVTLPLDDDDGELPISFEGNFQAPDRMRGILSLSLGFFKIETETILIGNTTFIKNPESDEWEVGADVGEAIPGFKALILPESAATQNLQPVLSGVVTLDGSPAYLLKVTLPQDVFGGEGLAGEADFWVGVNDFRIRQIVAEGEAALDAVAMPSGGSASGGDALLTMTLTLTNYDEPVEIEAPDVS